MTADIMDMEQAISGIILRNVRDCGPTNSEQLAHTKDGGCRR